MRLKITTKFWTTASAAHGVFEWCRA